MAELFVYALLGHLVGDYLLQTKQMALKKSERSWRGWWMCSAHVLIYTIVVCLMLRATDPLIWALVFVPHWLIDRFSFASIWLQFIGGTDFRGCVQLHRPPPRIRHRVHKHRLHSNR